MAYEDAQDQAPPMPQRSFGRLLRHYRRLVALSQEALAERAGVSMRAIGGMERDEGHTPYAATAHLLVDALGLTSVECAEFLAAARAPHGAATRLPIAQRRTMRSDAPTGNADSWESSGSLASNPPAQPLWRLPDLPLPLTPLIGRAHEVAQVCALLRDPDARLVTLCGPPGVGKTRLALQAAHSLHNEQDGRDRQGEHSADDPAISRVTSAFPDGIVFVDLAALRDPAQVIPAIAQALRIPSASGWTITERLIAILRQRRLLLLLDTCEHVLAAGAELVTLLQACPGVKALATSRAALQVRGEYELPVQPLALPGSPTNAPDEAALMELATTPAVALFISRAQTGAPAFALTRTNASAIVALCRRLDGLPLAIELAAARLTLFSPQELLARLERRLPMLTRAARDLPVRQRTLRDALTWSYDLLSPQEQAAFRHLAVFAGGATHEAAEVILQSASGRATQAAIADALAALGRQSLLSIQTLPPTKSDGQPITRIRLLDTIHEYAEERLLAAGEAPRARRAHARYFVRLAEVAEQGMWQGNTAIWERLPTELDNLRAALRWASEEAAHGDRDAQALGLRLGAAMAPLWYRLGQAPEGSRWLADLLRLTVRQPDDEMEATEEQARALSMAGWLAIDQGKLLRAEELLAASVAAYRLLNERGALADYARYAEALDRLGSARWRRGAVDDAIEALSEALGLCRQLGESAATAQALSRLGILLMTQGRTVEAEACFHEALALFRADGIEWGVVYTLAHQGDLARLTGEPDRAEALYSEALALAQGSHNRRAIAYILGAQGVLARTRGAAEQVKRLLQESLLAYQDIGDTGEEALILLALGDIACVSGDKQEGLMRYQEGLKLFHEISAADGVVASIERIACLFVFADQDVILRVTRLLGLCEAVRARLGFPLTANDEQRRASALALAREALDERRVTLAYETGFALSLEQGVADAQELAGA